MTEVSTARTNCGRHTLRRPPLTRGTEALVYEVVNDDPADPPLVAKVYIRCCGVTTPPEVVHVRALPPHGNIMDRPVAVTGLGAYPCALFPRYPTDLFGVLEARAQGRAGRAASMSEDEARPVFRQVVAAVAHCHMHGVAHFDVKAENVLVRAAGDGALVAVLTDFGTCCPLNEPCKRVRGTPDYQAPEMKALVRGPWGLPSRGEDPAVPFPLNGVLGGPADVWALGILLGFLVMGGTTAKAPATAILHAAAAGFKFSAALQDLFRQVLVEDPKGRPTAADLQRHPWLEGPVCSTAVDGPSPQCTPTHQCTPPL
jgi:hypothetical protein